MFERLKRRGARIADAASRAAIERLAREADLPGDVRIETDEKGLRLSGRALLRRMIDDPRLRSVAR